MKQPNMHCGSPRKRREKETIFEETIAENFMKDINIQTCRR